MGSKLNLHRNESVNQFKIEVEKRNGMEPRQKKLVRLGIAMAAIFVVMYFIPLPFKGSLNWIFSDPTTLADYSAMIRANFDSLGELITQTFDGPVVSNAAYGRLLNSIGAVFIGAGLAVTGTCFQGVFRNSIASPTTLGVISGGTAGATIYIMFFEYTSVNTVFSAAADDLNLIGLSGRILFILAGSFFAVLFTVCIARAAGRGKISNVALIITGMVFSGLVGSVSQIINMYMLMVDPYGEKTTQLRYAMSARIGCWSFPRLLMVMIPCGIVLVVMILFSKRLNLIVFGEDEARAMGVNIKKTRNTMIILCTVMMAFIIAICGGIGFVGLIVPHITRRFVGSDFRYLIPGSALVGGLFLLIVHYIPPCDFMGEGYVGNYTSIVGGIVFLYLIVKNRRNHHADWA